MVVGQRGQLRGERVAQERDELLVVGAEYSLETGVVDFFGDELESLRTFDPTTQMSTGALADHLLHRIAWRDLPEEENDDQHSEQCRNG